MIIDILTFRRPSHSRTIIDCLQRIFTHLRHFSHIMIASFLDSSMFVKLKLVSVTMFYFVSYLFIKSTMTPLFGHTVEYASFSIFRSIFNACALSVSRSSHTAPAVSKEKTSKRSPAIPYTYSSSFYSSSPILDCTSIMVVLRSYPLEHLRLPSRPEWVKLWWLVLVIIIFWASFHPSDGTDMETAAIIWHRELLF